LSLSPAPTSPPLFPYTPLFRSPARGPLPGLRRADDGAQGGRRQGHLCDQNLRTGAEAVGVPRACRRGAEGAQSVLTWDDGGIMRSEEHTSELQSRENLVCRLLL